MIQFQTFHLIFDFIIVFKSTLVFAALPNSRRPAIHQKAQREAGDCDAESYLPTTSTERECDKRGKISSLRITFTTVSLISRSFTNRQQVLFVLLDGQE